MSHTKTKTKTKNARLLPEMHASRTNCLHVAEDQLEKARRTILQSAFRRCVPARPPGPGCSSWVEGGQNPRGLQDQEEETVQACFRGEAVLSLPAEELLQSSHGEQGGGQDTVIALRLHPERQAGIYDYI